MNYRKTGIIVLCVCIGLALVVFCVSKIHIGVKSNTGEEVKVTESPVNVELKDSRGKEETEPPSETVEPTLEPVQTEEPQQESSNNWQEVEESSLKYAKDTQSVSGTVTDKKIYNTGDSQLVYDVEVTSVLGNSEQVFNYYCTYNTYNELKLKDLVLVEYKQVGDKNFVVCSLSK